SLLPILVLLLVRVLVVILDVVVFRFLVVVIVIVVFVVRRDVEFDRRETDDLEVRAAFGTTDLVALVDVEFVDFNFGIALGTGGHNALRSLKIPLHQTIASIADSSMASTSVAIKTVLIADDNPLVRERFRAAVEQSGHKAIAVKSTTELLTRLRANRPSVDLVVLDLQLPRSP